MASIEGDDDMADITFDRALRGAIASHRHAEVAADVESLAAAGRNQDTGRKRAAGEFPLAGKQRHLGALAWHGNRETKPQPARPLRQRAGSADLHDLVRIERAGESER